MIRFLIRRAAFWAGFRFVRLVLRGGAGLSILVTAVGALGLFSSGASAGTTIIAGDAAVNAPLLQSWIDSSKVATPDAKVTVYARACPTLPTASGCGRGDSRNKTGQVWIYPSYFRNPSDTKPILFHENYHVFDHLLLNDADRLTISAGFGFPAGTPWSDPTNGIESFRGSPAEWFAEGGSTCAIGDRWAPAYGFPFKRSQLNWLCSLIDAVAARKPPAPLVRTTFTQKLGPHKRFESSTLFEPGTVRFSVTIDGRTWRSNSSCTDTWKFNRVQLAVNGCTKKLVVWSRGTRGVTFTFSGIPLATPTSKPGTVTPLAARKKKPKRHRSRVSLESQKKG